MKITEHRFGEATDPNSRMQRLGVVLSAWQFPRLAHRADRGMPPPGTELSASEMKLWLAILRAAAPVPPHTHLQGLTTYARLHGLRVEDLEREKAVLILGDQVSVRGQLRGLGFLGYHWSLLVPAKIGGRKTEPILRKRFQEVEAHGDELIAWGAWETCTDSIAALTYEALTAAPEALLRLWRISLALHVEYRFLPALPAVPTKELAAQLGAELEAAADRLTLETDARLLRFALGREDGFPAVMPLHLPESRLARLLEIDRFFDHARHRFSDAYYDAMASALARIATPSDLGKVLQKLQPGSALISALDQLYLDRPEYITNYAFFPPLHAEGAFALLQLQQQMNFGQPTKQLELKEEWLQAQELGRQVLLLGNHFADWDSLVALGIHDESHAIGRRNYGVAPIDRNKVPYDSVTLWAEVVSDAARAPHYVEALAKHFQARRRQSDPATVFALRLLAPLRKSGQEALAVRLATAVADGYVAALALDAPSAGFSSVLPAYGPQLAALRESLGAASEAWRRFLRPFDTQKYLEAALEDQGKSTSTTNNPSFIVPRILKSHAETLIALASANEPFEEPLRAALELRDADRKAGLHVGAFSWTQLARITSFGARPVGEPLFVAVGNLFAKVTGSPPWRDVFLRDEAEPHILAALAAGLGPSHPLTEAIRPKLRAGLEELLSGERGVVLGHALELANLLQMAQMPQEAERFAREALSIVDVRLPHGNDAFSPVARALLAGALAQQKRWAEILAFEPDRNQMVLSPHARFVENMRALALMESRNLAEAEEVLLGILKIEESNTTALVNLTALHLRASDWPKVIEAATAARQRLTPGDDYDHVLLNEAHACEKLGDRFRAAQLLKALSGSMRERPDVIAALDELLHTGGAQVPLPPVETAAGSAVDAPPLDALLAAVETLENSTEKGRALEELMTRLFCSIPGFQFDGRNVHTETEEIDITLINGSTDPRFVKEQPLMLVECKNWTSKCGRPELSQFQQKVNNRNQRCTLGFLVSWNGFAETVAKEMLRSSRDEAVILLITGEHVRRAVRSGKFADEVFAVWRETLLT